MGNHRYYGMNLQEAALLVETYLEVEWEPRLRQQKLSQLSARMRRKASTRTRVGPGFGNMASLNYQFNKLEYLMTGGKKGFGGACPQVLTDIVELYRTDRAAFLDLLDEAKGKRKRKTTAAPAEVATKQAPEEPNREQPVTPADHSKKAAPGAVEKRRADGSAQDAQQLARTLAALQLSGADSVTNLPLSHRLGNALLRNGVYVVDDFLKLSPGDMEEKLHLGKALIREACLYQDALRDVLLTEEPAPAQAAGALKAAEPAETYGAATQEAEDEVQPKKPEAEEPASGAEKRAGKMNPAVIDMAELSLRLPQLARDDSIDKLGLPNRLANTLHRNDVHTIGAFCHLSAEDMLNMRNLGKKSVREAQFYQKFLEERLAGNLPLKAEQKLEVPEFATKLANPEIQEKLDFMLQKGISAASPADSLPLSNRGKNILSQTGVKTVADFLALPPDFWPRIKNCGKMTQDEFQTVYDAGKLLLLSKPVNRNGQDQTIADGIVSYMGESLGMLIVRQLPVGAGVVQALWENQSFRGYIVRHILLAAQKNGTLSGLKQEIPVAIYDEQAFRSVLDELVAKKKIKLDGDVVSIRYPTLQEFIASISKENQREALVLRLQGLTLEEIGRKLGVTRERVRQMNTKVLEHRPTLADDQFLPTWEKYRYLTDDDYEKIFGWTKERLNYFQLLSDTRKGLGLRTKTKKSRADNLLQILHDFADNQTIVSRVRQLGRKVAPYILIDGRKIAKNRQGLMRYVSYRYCQDTVTYKTFKQKYGELLAHLGLGGEKRLALDGRYASNHLSTADYILWTRGQHLRYFDINSVDTDAFFDDIGLYNYQDVEISALKIFRECPDVMKTYDIRDEYELHNLLKKLWGKNQPKEFRNKSHTLTFGRMPIITIGQGNREQQVMDLMNENAPISQQDLAEMYEEEYGVRAASVSANYFGCIVKYLNQKGIYTTSWPELSEDAKAWLKEHLTKDFYYIRDIEDILLDEFPEEHVWAINSHTLRELGFIPASRYVVRNTFGSPIQYFRSLLARDVCDLRGRQDLMNIGAFYTEVNKQKESFQMVEMEPHLYESMEALNRKGVTLDSIHDFGKEVDLFQEDGAFFTIHSLRRAGFALPWPGQHFKDWFYSSLLVQDREHFSYTRYGGGRLLRKSKERFSLADFLHYVADHVEETIEFHDFVRLIQKTYGFSPDEYRMKDAIADDYELSQKVEVL